MSIMLTFLQRANSTLQPLLCVLSLLFMSKYHCIYCFTFENTNFSVRSHLCVSCRWTVKRRFSDFDNISSWIATVFPNFPLPELPSKLSTVFGSVEDVANKRRAPLQDWLQHIRMVDELALTYEFARFLGVYDNVLHNDPQSSALESSPKSRKLPKAPPIRRDLINFDPKPGTPQLLSTFPVPNH